MSYTVGQVFTFSKLAELRHSRTLADMMNVTRAAYHADAKAYQSYLKELTDNG